MDKIVTFYSLLEKEYDCFKQKEIVNWRISHEEYFSFLEIRKNSEVFKVAEVGKSLQSKKILLLKAGVGKIKIVFWSQMHGNEPTASQALLDIFNFLENKNKFQAEIKEILTHCTLYFLPMLNPDGANAFTRRNFAGIDINRDASRLQSPEAKILMNLIDEIKPHFAFNLHDQDKYYAVGNTNKTAIISLLAPSGDELKTVNQERVRSFKLAATITQLLQNDIPEHVSRYADNFMPAAFGDCIQQKGTSVLLIESGYKIGDNQKQFVRKLNFKIILSGILSISQDAFNKVDNNHYLNLSFNKKNVFFDIIVRGLQLKVKADFLKVDVGIRVYEEGNQQNYVVEELGDLSGFHGFYETSSTKTFTFHEIKIGDSAQFLLGKINFKNR